MGKAQFTPFNCHKNLLFNLQLQNQIMVVIQLLKPGMFDLLSGSKGGFLFVENKKIKFTHLSITCQYDMIHYQKYFKASI